MRVGRKWAAAAARRDRDGLRAAEEVGDAPSSVAATGVTPATVTASVAIDPATCEAPVKV